MTPEETGFLRYLKAAKVTLNEYEFPTSKVANVQSQLQRLIEKKQHLSRYQDQQKFIAYLARQGFSYDEIKRALSEQAD